MKYWYFIIFQSVYRNMKFKTSTIYLTFDLFDDYSFQNWLYCSKIFFASFTFIFIFVAIYNYKNLSFHMLVKTISSKIFNSIITKSFFLNSGAQYWKMVYLFKIPSTFFYFYSLLINSNQHLLQICECSNKNTQTAVNNNKIKTFLLFPCRNLHSIVSYYLIIYAI